MKGLVGAAEGPVRGSTLNQARESEVFPGQFNQNPSEKSTEIRCCAEGRECGKVVCVCVSRGPGEGGTQDGAWFTGVMEVCRFQEHRSEGVHQSKKCLIVYNFFS